MFLKILAERMAPHGPMVNFPAVIGRPQPFLNPRGEAPQVKPAFDHHRMTRQAAATEVLCAVLKGEIPGFGKCARRRLVFSSLIPATSIRRQVADRAPDRHFPDDRVQRGFIGGR